MRALIAGSRLGMAAALGIYFFGQNSQVGAILLNMAVFGAVIAYILQMASFLILRRKDLDRPYVSPLGVAGALDRHGDRRGHAGRPVSESRLQQRSVRRGDLVRAGHRLLRVLCAQAAGFVARRRVRAIKMELKTLLAKATPARSGDELAGIAAESAEERVARRWNWPILRSTRFQNDALWYDDEVTRLIIDTHASDAFAPIAHLTVGEFREWLLRSRRPPRSLRSRSDARNGRRGFENHAAAGSDRRRGENPRGHEISRHARASRPAVDALAAESSHRRSARSREPASSTD